MNEIEIFEGDRAGNYNDFVRTWIPQYEYFISLLPSLIDLKKNQHILVAGCGTGSEIEQLVNSDKEFFITGVDPSPEMLFQARRKFKDDNNVKLIDGIVNQLRLRPKFGAATLILVLHFLKDDGSKLELLRDISKRIEKGGQFILLDISGNQEDFRMNIKVLKKILPDYLDNDDIKKRLKRIENELHPVSDKRLRELLSEAGFNNTNKFYQNTIYSAWISKKA